MEVRRGTSKQRQHRGIQGHPLPPQILYSYPAGKAVTPDVANFCFPHGVQPVLLERTPSMSALNEVVYSQQYRSSDGQSFIFLMKVADNLPLYGVCCYMDEIVHRPPQLLRYMYPHCNKPLLRYLVSAPRCYCFLTHYPFFSLHLKVLHLVMGLERLERITAFISEVETKDGDMKAGSTAQEEASETSRTATRKLWEASPPGETTPTGGDSSSVSAPSMQRSASLLARATMRIKAAASFGADANADAVEPPKSPKQVVEGGSILKRASERMLRASASARARRISSSGESSDSNSCGTSQIAQPPFQRPRPQEEATEGTPRSAISEITSRASGSFNPSNPTTCTFDQSTWEAGSAVALGRSISCASVDSASGLSQPFMNGKALENVRLWNLRNGSAELGTTGPPSSGPSPRGASDGPSPQESLLTDPLGHAFGKLGLRDQGRGSDRAFASQGLLEGGSDLPSISSVEAGPHMAISSQKRPLPQRSQSTGILPRNLSGQFGAEVVSGLLEERRSSHGIATSSTEDFQLDMVDLGLRSLRSQLSIRSSLGEEVERQGADALEVGP
eukprot:jgi/Botrbrau1/8841/Bobra.50_2s0001.1